MIGSSGNFSTQPLRHFYAHEIRSFQEVSKNLADERERWEWKMGLFVGTAVFGAVIGLSVAVSLGAMTTAVAATSAVVLGIALAILFSYLNWHYDEHKRQISIPYNILHAGIYSIGQIYEVVNDKSTPREAVEAIKDRTGYRGDWEAIFTSELGDADANTVYPFPTIKLIFQADDASKEQFILNQIFTSSVGLIKQIAAH